MVSLFFVFKLLFVLLLMIQKVLFLLKGIRGKLWKRNIMTLLQHRIIMINLNQSLNLLLPSHLLRPPTTVISLNQNLDLLLLFPITVISLILLLQNLLRIQTQTIQISLEIVMVQNPNQMVQMVQDTTNLTLVLQINPTAILRISRQNPHLA